MIKKGGSEVLETPQKPPSDVKDYKMVKLPNGLKALLATHVKSESDEAQFKDTTSAVALCIDMGSFEDCFEVQGLSHFLEHMVFMGSKKYPKENEFDQFIKSRNGFDNAMTECEFTIFYFRIDEEHLAGALDRFSQFFIAPLMLKESMKREMEAVESEFQNEANNDSYRINQIFASMVRNDHPASYFTWGNLKTLKTGVRSDELHLIVHAFFKKFYKSNRMSLCIQSSLSLEEQQKLVEQYFSEITPEYGTIWKKSSVDPFIDVFKPEFYKKMFFVKSKTKKRKMFLTFLLPTMEDEYKNRSLDYLAFLFNNEGRESLNSFFRKRSLASHVSAKIGSRNFEGNSMFTFFTIEVCLTRDGYEDMGRVLDAVFGYLFIIKMTPLDEHKEIYEEFKEVKNTFCKYQKEKSPIENVQELALNMRYFEDKDSIIGRGICPEFDEIAMKTMIGRINDHRFKLMVLSDQYQKYDKIEKWFGTEYAEVDFPFKYAQYWNERWIRKEFSLPLRNRFICKNFEIVADIDEHRLDYPLMIFKNDFCKCFFRTDDKFKLPHGYVYVHFKSSVTESSVTYLNMTSIFSMCIKNYLSEKLHPARVAGYSYKLNSAEDGLVLKLSGFNEKLPMILDLITKAIKNTDDVIEKPIFDFFRKELKKNCYNLIINSNLFNEELRLNIINPNHKFYFDRFKDVDKITYMDFKEFLIKFLKSLQMKILIQGNFRKSQALEMTQTVIRNLNQEKIEVKNVNEKKAHQIPVGSVYLRIKSLFPKDKNSVIKSYYQIGERSTESKCLVELLVKVMREPLFNFIRTQEQLGYAVTCASKLDDDMLGFTVTVESQEKRHSSWDVDGKVESFLRNFSALLQNLNEKDFEMIKHSIIAHRRAPDTELESEVNRNWTEIRDSNFEFERNVIEVRQFELLRRDDLLVFFNDHFSPATMRKLSVHIVANADDADDSLLQHGFIHLDLLTDDAHNSIKSIAQFRNTLASMT